MITCELEKLELKQKHFSIKITLVGFGCVADVSKSSSALLSDSFTQLMNVQVR